MGVNNIKVNNELILSISQETGNSTTDLMSQKAVSDYVSELSSHLCDAGIQYPYMFANGYWYDPTSSHIIFQIFPGANITLQPVTGVYYSLLKTYNPPSADGETYSQDMFATGYDNRVYAASKITITAPSDAKYLYIACGAGTVFDVISILTVNDVSLLDNLAKRLASIIDKIGDANKEVINVLEEIILKEVGELTLTRSLFLDRRLIAISNGEETENENRYITDFIPINVETDRITASGLQANASYASIAMYNANKEYIAGYANGTLNNFECSPNTAFIKLSADASYINVVSAIIYRNGYVIASKYIDGNLGDNFTCYREPGNPQKAIANDDFYFGEPCRLLVKFLYANEADNVVFNGGGLNSQDKDRPLYYNGQPASATNSWKAGDILEIYYNATDDIYYAKTYYAKDYSEDLSNLSSKIDSVDKKTQMVRGDVAFDIKGTIGVGGILADGSYSTNTDVRCSDFIPVERPKKYRAKGHRGSSGWLVVCFYDKDKQPLVSESPTQTGYDIDVTFQPSFDTAYVRVGGDAANGGPELYEVSESVGEEIAKLKLNIFGELTITPEWFFDKVYLYTDGTFPEASNRLTTDFIPVNGGEVIEYTNLQAAAQDYIMSIATYDANKNIIPAGCYNGRTGSHDVPANTAYIRLCAYTDLTGTVAVIKGQSLVKGNSSHWVNEYPGIFDGTRFKEKYLKREDDITILVIGDSLSAFHNQMLYENPANRPCQMICHNWIGNLWDYLNDTEITADRFDSAINAFTEIGTFEDGYSMFEESTLPYWTADAMTNSGKTQSGSLTRYSNTTNAAVAFSWDLDAYEKLHFIHRKDYRAADNVTINISEGNGKVLVLDEGTDTWVEANGYQFTQKIDQSAEGSGYSQTLSNWRLKMKKVVGATGSVTLTFTASGEGYLFYWGTERWNGNRIIVVNSSRGGRECIYFRDVIRNDIAGRKPDLVLVACMLINEYGDVGSKTHLTQTVVDNFQDLFIGDRTDHTTDMSLKAQSNDWNDFDVIAIIPHIRYEYFNENSDMTFKKTNLHDSPNIYMDEIAPVVWNRVKNMLMDKGVKVVDVGLALKREILTKELSYKDAFNSHGMYAENGVTQDTVHQNILGSMLWAKHIAPIFDII